MKNKRFSESGQAIILIILGIVGILAFTALAIDGGRLYLERRNVQNAADNSALASVLALCTGDPDLVTPALTVAAQNGYNNSGANSVTLYNPPATGPYTGDPNYVEVVIDSTIDPGFLHIFEIFTGPMTVKGRAVGYCKPETQGGDGNAIFAYSDWCQNTIDYGGSYTWIDGGIHTNNDMHVGGSTALITGYLSYVTSVDAPEDKITFDPPPPANPVQTSHKEYPLELDIVEFAPGGAYADAAAARGEYYFCNTTINTGWLEDEGLLVDGVLQPGLYYTSDDISLSSNGITGNGVTFVARDQIQFSTSEDNLEPYDIPGGILAFTDIERSGGAQCSVAGIKLSGSSHIWGGIIFAPNALIEMSGASDVAHYGAIIGFNVALNGSNIEIHYDQNYFPPKPPSVELAE
jgi:Rieske Fe-S protein